VETYSFFEQADGALRPAALCDQLCAHRASGWRQLLFT
jgi:hypothetical protein